jgi:uncharacterized repeat protein (TIGR02543 family)
VDGNYTLTAPAFLAWKMGETHSIEVNEAYDRPDGSRYVFNSWKHGGERIQQYAKPVEKDTLEARFDLIYEAESGTLSQGTMDSNWPGFTGTGFANVANQTGSYLDLTLSIPQTGDWNIRIRYSSASAGNRSCEISVDGQKVTLDFPPTGDWSTWSYSGPAVFNLTAGSHTLRITGLTSESAPNLDHMKLSQVSAVTGQGVITGRITPPGAPDDLLKFGVTLYNATWNQIDSDGNSYVEHQFDYAFSDLPSGDYYVQADASVLSWDIPSPYATYLTKDVWIQTYYSNAIDHANATSVHVSSSDTIKNIDIALRYASVVRIGTDPTGIPVTVDGAVCSRDSNFVWKETDTHSIGVESFNDNSDGSRNCFSSWKQGGAREQDYEVPPGQFNVVSDSLIARFDRYFKLDVQVNDTTQGIVIVDPSGEWQKINTTVKLTAFPKSGFTFTGWEGDFTGTRDSISIVMDMSKTLSARFAWIDTTEINNAQSVPQDFTLMQNYPNPFNAETRIHYGIPKSCHVILTVHGLDGSRVRTLLDDKLPGGAYDATWNARDDLGNPVPSGVYLVRLRAEDRILIKKTILVK